MGILERKGRGEGGGVAAEGRRDEGGRGFDEAYGLWQPITETCTHVPCWSTAMLFVRTSPKRLMAAYHRNIAAAVTPTGHGRGDGRRGGGWRGKLAPRSHESCRACWLGDRRRGGADPRRARSCTPQRASWGVQPGQALRLGSQADKCLGCPLGDRTSASLGIPKRSACTPQRASSASLGITRARHTPHAPVPCVRHTRHAPAAPEPALQPGQRLPRRCYTGPLARSLPSPCGCCRCSLVPHPCGRCHLAQRIQVTASLLAIHCPSIHSKP
jgi:hypothetical protein